MRKLCLLIAVITAALIAASCKASTNWIDFALSGGDIQFYHVEISVSNQYPAPGEEIRVRAAAKSGSAAEHEASFLFFPSPPSLFTYTATAGQFRCSDGELNDPAAVYEGQQIKAGCQVYWRAPAEPGKVILAASGGGSKDSIKAIVQDHE